MNDKQSILTKQQLFINPISIIQKLINKHQPHSSSKQNQINHLQINPQKQSPNFNQLLLQTIDSQTQFKTNSKTKQIIKSMTQLSSNQLKNKHYRTQMCPDGIQCRKRLVCQFAHNQYQLRRPYKNRKNPCIRYQKGLCSLGAACPDYHGNMDIKKKNYKYKTQKCKQFEQKGSCSKGKLCIYIHDESQNNQQESIQNQIQLQNQQVNDQKVDQQNNQDKKQSQIQNRRQKDQSMIKKQKIGDIFNSKKQGKKIIAITQVVQQIIQPKQKQPQNNQQNQQQQNFNIQFTF